MQLHQVCDHACGTGRYGDYHCNWRNHGLKCRHCFDDLHEALIADKVAQQRGGRVIMCDTYEPPRQPLDVQLGDEQGAVVKGIVAVAQEELEEQEEQGEAMAASTSADRAQG